MGKSHEEIELEIKKARHALAEKVDALAEEVNETAEVVRRETEAVKDKVEEAKGAAVKVVAVVFVATVGILVLRRALKRR